MRLMLTLCTSAMLLVANGCASRGQRSTVAESTSPPARAADDQTAPDGISDGVIEARTHIPHTLASHQDDPDQPGDAESNENNSDPEERTPPSPPPPPPDEDAIPSLLPDADEITRAGPAIRLGDVVTSIHQSFPLVEAAYLEASIANGNQLATWGAFDTKLKAGSENGPSGFYQTYRQNAGFERPIYDGGHVFGGYRIGRGDFEPWYLERQTNDGGEFKGGVRVPLLRNREIDARRAELWRATYDRQRARPEIRAQLIQFVRDGSLAYWQWIAAGQRYEIGRRALRLSVERNAFLKRIEEVGGLDPPVRRDNQRSIALRESKLIDRRRKLQQAAIKLSLFYRASDGSPFVPNDDQLAAFAEPAEVDRARLEGDIQTALFRRPELAALDALYRRLSVDLAEACNDFLPSLDAQVSGSQDTGAPTSSKRDKSQFEVEAGVFLDVPIQRRKARGKSQAAQAKMRQISVKRRFAQDKIVADVRSAFAALIAAWERIEFAREARRLAEYMADVERTRFRAGEGDLLSVFLRERSAIEAADGEVDALLEYFSARADYSAALAIDIPE